MHLRPKTKTQKIRKTSFENQPRRNPIQNHPTNTEKIQKQKYLRPRDIP